MLNHNRNIGGKERTITLFSQIVQPYFKASYDRPKRYMDFSEPCWPEAKTVCVVGQCQAAVWAEMRSPWLGQARTLSDTGRSRERSGPNWQISGEKRAKLQIATANWICRLVGISRSNDNPKTTSCLQWLSAALYWGGNSNAVKVWIWWMMNELMCVCVCVCLCVYHRWWLRPE